MLAGKDTPKLREVRMEMKVREVPTPALCHWIRLLDDYFSKGLLLLLLLLLLRITENKSSISFPCTRVANE